MAKPKGSRDDLDLALLPKEVARGDYPDLTQPEFAADPQASLSNPGERPFFNPDGVAQAFYIPFTPFKKPVEANTPVSPWIEKPPGTV